ncbi:MAG: Ig-like domain-containing protein [Candidatus Symbiothrix sp.]|jgi:hypothetical protein|nr:Ig-like domain-containing protein [Candidatus Symbiothrix sp.]
MRTKSFLYLAMTLVIAAVTWSCGEDSEEKESVTATGITLDQKTASIEVESTVVLKATLQPEGATGTIIWSTSNSEIASVNNGVVTGISAGKVTIAAQSGAFSDACEVTVTPKAVDISKYPSLQGSNYYLLQLGESARASIAGKIILDLSPDDVNKWNYIWPESGDSFLPGPAPSGLNCYGQPEGWISLMAGTLGWSGGGYAIATGFGTIDMTDLFTNVNDYVFHIALKATHNKSFMFTFNDAAAEAKFVIGAASFEDNGKSYQPDADFARDGEWHEVEFPLSAFNGKGVFYRDAFQDKNVFAYLAGGVAGTTLEYDAVFFYKPKK